MELPQVINFAAGGDNTVSPVCPADKCLLITSLWLMPESDCTIQFKDTGGNKIGGNMVMTSATGTRFAALAYNPKGHFITSVGEAFVVNSNNANQVWGGFTYKVVSNPPKSIDCEP